MLSFIYVCSNNEHAVNQNAIMAQNTGWKIPIKGKAPVVWNQFFSFVKE